MHDVGNFNMGKSAAKSRGISQCLDTGHPVICEMYIVSVAATTLTI